MINVENLGFFYERGKWLFRSVDFSLNKGETLALLGPNGRGKTTLLRCIARLISSQEGRIDAPQKIGFVPQLSTPPPGFSVLDIVLMGAAGGSGLFETPGKKELERAMEAMSLVGVDSLAKKDFSDLSGGQRQMVLIARALCYGRSALILDEPASALDLANQKKLLDLLGKLASDGTTIIMTTHAPNHAFDVADKSLMLFGGTDFVFGDTKKVVDAENLSRLFDTQIMCVEYEAGGKKEIAAIAV